MIMNLDSFFVRMNQTVDLTGLFWLAVIRCADNVRKRPFRSKSFNFNVGKAKVYSY